MFSVVPTQYFEPAGTDSTVNFDLAATDTIRGWFSVGDMIATEHFPEDVYRQSSATDPSPLFGITVIENDPEKVEHAPRSTLESAAA